MLTDRQSDRQTDKQTNNDDYISSLAEVISNVAYIGYCIAMSSCISNKYKNSSGDEIANVNFYAVRPELPDFAEITQHNAITTFNAFMVTDFGTISVKFLVDVNGWPRCLMP